MQKILLFGSQGMLGSEFFEMYHQEFEITPLARFHIDLAHPERISDVIKKYSPDIIVNTAGWTDVDKAEEEYAKKELFDVNSKSVEIIAKECEKKNIPFYHISTDFVFNGKKGESFSETDIPNPGNMYGKSKLEGENLALQYNETRIIRTAWLTGKNGHNFVSQIVHLAKTRPSFPVVDDRFGSPSFCEDVSHTLYEMIKNPEKYKKGIYHAINEGSASRYDIAKEILKILEIEKEIEAVSSTAFPLPANRPTSSVLKNTLLPCLPHWKDSLRKHLEEELEKLKKEREVIRKKKLAKEKYFAQKEKK